MLANLRRVETLIERCARKHEILLIEGVYSSAGTANASSPLPFSHLRRFCRCLFVEDMPAQMLGQSPEVETCSTQTQQLSCHDIASVSGDLLRGGPMSHLH